MADPCFAYVLTLTIGGLQHTGPGSACCAAHLASQTWPGQPSRNAVVGWLPVKHLRASPLCRMSGSLKLGGTICAVSLHVPSGPENRDLLRPLTVESLVLCFFCLTVNRPTRSSTQSVDLLSTRQICFVCHWLERATRRVTLYYKPSSFPLLGFNVADEVERSWVHRCFGLSQSISLFLYAGALASL